MPPPGNATEFLTVVEKSGLLKEDDLERYRFQSAADPSPPDRVAKWMLMDGRLTQFQVGLLLAGKTHPFFLASYKVLSRIGNGSVGVVYLCEDKDMGRKVAVKVLQKRHVKDGVAVERFLREARASAAITHPNVVHALDFGSENKLHYLVMEYVDGRSLKEIVLNDGPLTPLKAASYLKQAAQGLQHAHQAGLIHRDIKPSNLMVTRSGVVKLLDLGLARLDDSNVDLTQGNPLGTLAYSAPEQAKDGHTVDARADIYSLGTTFYLALTGRAPKPGIGIGEVVPPDLSDPANFERLMAVLRKMTARSPKDRYQCAAEVAAEMDFVMSPPAPIPMAVPQVVPQIDSDSIETDELYTVESLGQTPGYAKSDELLQSNPVIEEECSQAEVDKAETVESTALEEETASKPALEMISNEPQVPSKSSTKLSSNPTSETPPNDRSTSSTKRKRISRWRSTQRWVESNITVILFVLAGVVGLLAALNNR